MRTMKRRSMKRGSMKRRSMNKSKKRGGNTPFSSTNNTTAGKGGIVNLPPIEKVTTKDEARQYMSIARQRKKASEKYLNELMKKIKDIREAYNTELNITRKDEIGNEMENTLRKIEAAKTKFLDDQTVYTEAEPSLRWVFRTQPSPTKQTKQTTHAKHAKNANANANPRPPKKQRTIFTLK